MHSRPSKFTLTAACSTVLAAAAVTGAVTLGSDPVAAQQADVIRPDLAAKADTAAGESRQLSRTLTDVETAHARARAAAQLRAAQRAARARAERRRAARAAARAAARQAAAARAAASSQASAPPAPAPSGSPQHIAMSLLGSYGWSSSQFSCLDELWTRESGWNPTAANASGAYGIPQALPGSKMASAGPDWQTNAETQIKWGLGYIKDLYRSPCGAWSHEESSGWY
ncbi:MAG TPA: transglycosylase SLT domain-containing protein [Streptosporangiaceae bacterium]|nr:transglycosylase SLT domain-containing protein [Streptosporangiaceae bacterium]